MDAFISTRLPDISRTKAQAAVDEGWVLLNGATATKAGAAIKAGDVVLVRALPQPPPLQVQEGLGTRCWLRLQSGR